MNRVPDPLADSLRGRIAYDGTRTPVKSVLFLLVCLAWLLPGLVGHDPWKTDEALALGAVAEMLRSGDWAVPMLAGEPYLDRAPLFFWTAAVFAQGLRRPCSRSTTRPAWPRASSWRSRWRGSTSRPSPSTGARAGRIAVLLLIGCLGLLIRAHEMSTDLAGLAGVSVGIAGSSLAVDPSPDRRPAPGNRNRRGVPRGRPHARPPGRWR